MKKASEEEIRFRISQSSEIFIKKLSRNDCGWADGAEYGHQNGVYIPREIRESGFFPPLSNINKSKPHIFETSIDVFWPSIATISTSNLKHYSNKGTEMHFTCVPKECFSDLTPASLFIGGRFGKEPVNGSMYWFMVVDSASEEAELVETIFDLEVDFHFGLFDPKNIIKISKDETEQLIEEINSHLKAGTLEKFIRSIAKPPAPEVFAERAQLEYLKQNNLSDLNPYKIQNPGDAIMKISRDIEYTLYKKIELRHRTADVIRILSEKGSDLVSAIVRGFPELDATFLSASQRRKNRSGKSFEKHIERFLLDGHVIFEEQAVTGGTRPDFVLPNVVSLNNINRGFDEALILSLKTTLRERWKQLALEKNFNCCLFLATVDDRVTKSAIDSMENQGICLVVPESLKKSKETFYKEKSNVITFRSFFDEQLKIKRPFLLRQT